MSVHRREWGRGDPVIALHPLGLESSAFAGFGRALARRGLRTIAVDLPGFGQTPAPEAPLSAEVLAEPVVAMARRMKTPPAVIGISMGGRVALEAALSAPEVFRSVIAIAPWLPWLRFRPVLGGARLLSPGLAERIRLEKFWPLLRRLAHFAETNPRIRDDALAQAGARLIYYFSCPATRSAFVSAAREMALDPAHGPRGFWTRLPDLAVSGAFAWGGRDRLVSADRAEDVAQALPQVPQLLLPCVAHALNGPHHLCLAGAVAGLLDGPLEDRAMLGEGANRRRRRRRGGVVEVGCLVEDEAAGASAQDERFRRSCPDA
jgi:pimeloyl-ACP methyl ester carboxylesterase